MAKALGFFRDSRGPYWVSGPRTDVPAEPPPPLIGPGNDIWHLVTEYLK